MNMTGPDTMTQWTTVTALALLAALCTGGLAVCVRAMWRLRPRRTIATLAADQTGTTTIEFAMVLPVAMFFALLLTQTMLVMAGQLFVKYAAFAATRTAVVQIGSGHDEWYGEPQNWIHVGGQGKFERIRRAAEFALVPCAGRLNGGTDAPAQAYVEGLAGHFNAYDRDAPAWVINLAADRLHYARANTIVALWKTSVHDEDGDDWLDTTRFTPVREGTTATFGPREPITVAVTHRLNLSVPIVAIFFHDGEHGGETSTYSRFYTQVTAHCTLPNEGIVQTLPEQPILERIEPETDATS